MLDKILLNAVLDDTFKRKIDNVSNNCLRGTSERDKCEKCIINCPEEAISPVRGGVYADPLLCTGCNLCVTGCYSRALTPPKRPYLGAMNKIVEEKSSTWSCMKTKREDTVDFGCLRTVDPRFLYGLLFSNLDHEIFLDLRKCEDCEYKNSGDEIEKVIDIEDYDSNFSFKYLSSKENEEEKKKEEKPLSRRDFFKNIFDDSKKQSKEIIRETSKSFGFDLDEKENIDYIIKILLRRGIAENRDTNFFKDFIFELDVSDSCTFCNECVVYCPTKALKIEGDRDSQKLILDLDLCNFCNRCLEKCRFEAFSKNPLKDLEKKTIHIKRKKKCKSCGIHSSILDEDGYCPTCAIRKGNRKNLR